MKYLLLAVVVGIGLFMLFGRNRGRDEGTRNDPPKAPESPGPLAMLACTHCGVHLPRSEALMDVAGRPYCSDAHRVAGPR